MEDFTVIQRTKEDIDPSRYNTRVIIDSKFKKTILKVQKFQKLSEIAESNEDHGENIHDHGIGQNHSLSPKILAYLPSGRPFSTQTDEITKEIIKEAEYYITSSIENEKIESANEIKVFDHLV